MYIIYKLTPDFFKHVNNFYFTIKNWPTYFTKNRAFYFTLFQKYEKLKF